MPIIDNRAPVSLRHDCASLGHVGPCAACMLAAARNLQQEARYRTGASAALKDLRPSCGCGSNQAYSRCSDDPPIGNSVGHPSAFCAQGITSSDGVTGVPGTLGNVVGSGTEEVRAMGSYGIAGEKSHRKDSFTRAEVLAVLKGHLALAAARPPEMNERDMLRALITVFERME